MRLSYLLLYAVVAMVLLPIVAVYAGWLSFNAETWSLFLSSRLPELLLNTFYLLIGVGLGVTILGVGLAWLVSMYEFPGRKWLQWLLILPMAMPAYVMAFVFLGFFDYSGPLQSWLRAAGLDFLTVSDIRTPVSVSIVMTAVLYPYVYLLARNAFLSQGRDYIDAAQSLGAGKKRIAWAVNMGMARPAIVAGLALALMETLADFGTVAIFNYDTFTLAIYKAWFDYFDLQFACQLASLLLLLVAVALMVETSTRGKRSYSDSKTEHPRKQLKGIWAWMASGYIVFIFSVCFILPVVQLIHWATNDLDSFLSMGFWKLVWHTGLLALIAAVLTAWTALTIGLLHRHHPSKWMNRAMPIAKLGYALPGTVLAVGIVMPLGGLENHVFTPLQEWLGVETPRQLLLGTLVALCLAYMVRFMTVAMGPIETSLSRLSLSIPEAAKSLGASRWRIFNEVYKPLIRPGVLLAMLMVFVDVMKEMPATLLMRPAGWDTLAVRVYEMTSEGEFERAALPALFILLVSVIPIVITIKRSQQD